MPLKVVVPETVSVPDKDMESLSDRVVDPPKETDPPPVKLVPAETVNDELSNSELAIFCPSKETSPEVSGRVIVLSVVGVHDKVPVGPPEDKTIWFEVEDRLRLVNVGEEVVDRF